MMNKILIVSKTRMHDNNVCVGAIDLTNKRSIRLLDSTGWHEDIINCPYEVYQLWNVSYRNTNRRERPHTEDVSVDSRTYLEETISSNQIESVLQQCCIPYCKGTLLDTFDGKLQCKAQKDQGKLYIGRNNVPSYSTCFWKCDRPLFLDHYGSYAYCDGAYQWGYKVRYVGVQDAIKILPKGTIIRLSLANWWSPTDSDDPERCYLQLSGWYE